MDECSNCRMPLPKKAGYTVNGKLLCFKCMTEASKPKPATRFYPSIISFNRRNMKNN